MTPHATPTAVLVAALAIALTPAACTPPPEAPTELDELSAYLFRNFENEDPAVMAAGLANLHAFFTSGEVDLDADYGDRAYAVSPLTEDDVADVEVPATADLSAQEPVALVARSDHAPEAQATVMIEPDQTMVEPASPDHYVRTFLDPEDPSCFPDRGCAVLRTTNNIVKDKFPLNMTYDMPKDFRWLEMGEPGSGTWAVMGRAWVPERVVGEAGSVVMEQSFSIDVFLRDGDGAIRYMALWYEMDMDVSSDVIAGTTKMGMNDMFEATEAYLDGD